MSQLTRRTFLRASGAAGVGAIAGCLNGGGDGETDSILIGGLEPLSGPFAAWAEVHEAGLEFALDDINADGGVLGADLELTVSDTGADAGEADSIFRRMVEQDGVVATTGAVSSDVGVRLSQTSIELEVPHFLHMAGDDQITSDETRHIFRVGLIPAVPYIQGQADAFADAGYTSIGAIVGDYAWGHAAADAIEQNFDQDVQIEVAPLGESDFSSYLRQFPDDLEMIIASGHPPGDPNIPNQALDVGLDPEVITGASTPEQLMMGSMTGDAIGKYVHPHNSDAYSDEFIDVAERFGEETGEQFNTHTAYGYVTGQLIAAALEEAGEADPNALANALRAIEVDTLFDEPVQYAENGDLHNTVLIYSNLSTDAPEYFPDGDYGTSEFLRSDPVPAPSA